MTRIAFIVFLLSVNLSIIAFTASGDYQSEAKLYQINNETERTINLTIETVDYDIALVTTPIWEKLLYAVQSNFHLEGSSYILADSSYQEKPSLNLSVFVDAGVVYVFIYSKNELFGNGTSGAFPSLTASNDVQYEEIDFQYLEQDSYPNLYGNSLENNGNNQIDDNEYRSYKAGDQIGDLTFYFQIEEEKIAVFLLQGVQEINKEFVAQLVKNVTKFAEESTTVPSYVLSFAVLDSTNEYLSYNVSSRTELMFVVSHINLNNTDVVLYRFNSNLVFEGYPASGWYNAWFVDWFRGFALAYPPYAIAILVLVSMGVSLSTTGIAHLILDIKQLRKDQKRVSHHNQLKRKAQETADRKLWLKVQSNDARIKELGRKIQFKLLGPRLLTALPFLLIFTTFRGTFGTRAYNLIPDRGEVLTILPFNIPNWFPLLGGWFSPLNWNPAFSVAGFGTAYLVSALASSILIQRFLGINIQIISPENPLKP